MQYEIIALAMSILASAALAAWQLRASSRELSSALGRATERIERAVERTAMAIHADIKASQEKLERKLKRGSRS